MRKRSRYASIDIHWVRDTGTAVLSAEYARYGPKQRIETCISSWDPSDDQFSEGQWLGGRVEICDVSPNGRYMAYIGTAFHRPVPSYFAISRPPCLTALVFEPIVYTSPCDAFFEDDRNYRLLFERPATSANQSYEKEGGNLLRAPWLPEGNPQADDLSQPSSEEAAAAYPAAVSYMQYPATTYWDPNDRLIVVFGFQIYAFSEEAPNGKLLIDLSDREFKKVPPPDWALQW